jgi:sec-independent protein translocase protein TatA
MGSMSLWHWIVVIGVVLLLFGRGKISELMGDVAQGIKAFKKGMSEDDSAKDESPKIEPAKAEAAKTMDHSTVESSAAKSQVS